MSSDTITTIFIAVNELLFDYERSALAGLEQVKLIFPSLHHWDTYELASHYQNFLCSCIEDAGPKDEANLTGVDWFNVALFLEAMNVAIPADSSARELEDVFFYAYARDYRPVEHFLDTIRTLNFEGYKTRILSTCPDQKHALGALGLGNITYSISPTSGGATITAELIQEILCENDETFWNTVMVGHLDNANAALGALCKFIAFAPDREDDGCTMDGQRCFRVLKDFKDLKWILESPDLINWRISVESTEPDDLVICGESSGTLQSNGPGTPEHPVQTSLTPAIHNEFDLRPPPPWSSLKSTTYNEFDLMSPPPWSPLTPLHGNHANLPASRPQGPLTSETVDGAVSPPTPTLGILAIAGYNKYDLMSPPPWSPLTAEPVNDTNPPTPPPQSPLIPETDHNTHIRVWDEDGGTTGAALVADLGCSGWKRGKGVKRRRL